MTFIKLSTVFLLLASFFTGCESIQTEQTTQVPSNTNGDLELVANEYDDIWARDNFDLQRVGEILDVSKDARDFEYRLNSDNGLNNLDLNGDGYADYISVSEYDDRDNNQRGFSLFNKFDGNGIQELASIIFDRDRPDRRGARVYINGNDQIYGDDYFYERDWLDKSLDIVNWAYGDRNDRYQSPYYYDNYPEDYNVYRVVDTPVYRTRVTQMYPEPVFVQVNPAMIKIKIKSPYDGRSIDNIYAKLAKPSKAQKEFKEKNPNRPEFVPVRNGKDKGKNNSSKPDKRDDDNYGNDKKDKSDKGNKSDKSDKRNENPGKSDDKGNKPEKNDDKGGKNKGNDKNKGGGKPDKN